MKYSDLPDSPGLRELLDEQQGVVSVTQLERCGISAQFAAKRVHSRRWQRPHRGVFALFSGQLSRSAAIWAAILRAGSGAVASHQTAAELHGLCETTDPEVHVTIPAPRRVRGRYRGIVIHHAHRLLRTRHPTLSPPRTRVDDTILDLIDGSRSAQEAASWVLRAVQRRKTTPDRLAAALASRKKIRWRAMTEAMLLHTAEGAESMLEIRHMQKVERNHGLPTGKRQRRVAGNRVIWVDVDYDAFRLRVELDGRLGHVEEGEFRDRRRDNRATVEHRSTLRYGHADVYGSPCAVAAEQAYVMQQRGWTGEPRVCGPDCQLPAAIVRLRRDVAA